MFTDNQKVAKNSMYYVIVNSLPYLTSFITLPFYTRALSTSEFGILGLINVFSTIFGILIIFQISGSLSRFYFDSEDRDYKKELFSTLFFSSLLIGFIFVLVISLSGEFLLRFIYPNDPDLTFLPFFGLALLNVFISNLYALGNNLLLIQERANVIFKRTLFLQPLNIFLGIFLVYYLDLGILGALYNQIILSSLSLLVTFYVIKDYFVFTYNYSLFVSCLKFSLPLIPYSLGGFLFLSSDLIILKWYVSLEEIGLYFIAIKLALVIRVFVDSINNSLIPQFMRNAKESVSFTLQRFDEIIILWSTIFAIVFTSVSFFAKEILFILTDSDYHGAFLFVPFLTISWIFRGFYQFSSHPLFFEKQTKVLPLINIIAGTVNLALNLYFIPIYGVIAAAASTTICYIIQFSLGHFLAGIYAFRVKYDFYYIVSLFSVCISLVAFSIYPITTQALSFL